MKWALGLTLLAGGCFNPSTPTGVPCGDNNACPEGQQCIAGICGGTSSTDDGSMSGSDAVLVDASALCSTWNARHFDPCNIPAPTGDLNLTLALTDFVWDTDNGVLKGKMGTTIPVVTKVITQTGGPDVLVASVANFMMEADTTLDVTGPRPLLIAVWGTASIAGEIEVSAIGSTPGPGGSGAQSTYCDATPTGDNGATRLGGGGGAFQGNGGRGGNTVGGNGVAIPPPTVIRGGCGGGLGGASTGGTTAPRGAGGGAIEISARTSIALLAGAEIEASGAGGSFGRSSLGGAGGGGSGGYIGLDAPMVRVAGVLAANGGGGGGGASDVANGTSGSAGGASANAALGGNGATATNVGACLKGGNGSSGGTLTGETAGNSACGGGGGGGGAGYILIWSPTLEVTGVVSPPVLAGPP